MSETENTSKKIKNPKGRRWPYRIKVQAIEEVDSGLLSPSEVMEKYGFSAEGTLRNWRRQVARGPGRTLRPHRPDSLKRRIASEVHQGLKSMGDAMEECKINSDKTIQGWIARYCLSGSEMDKLSLARSEKHTSDYLKIKAELETARLMILGLETMIEVAEEELGVQIRKKSGTKQSKE